MTLKRFYLRFRFVLGLLLAGMMGTAVYAHLDTFHVYLSPGPLSEIGHQGEELGGYDSHAMFEEECTHCHAPVHCITDNKCQNCHLEIARQRTETVGLHSRLPGTEKCQNCHVEHRGREAVISAVALSNINHEELSGFSLEKHELGFDGATMVCEDCHTDGRFSRDEVSCLACHEDADGELIAQHSSEHGQECLACHNGTGAIVEFDHSTVYALTDGHENATCTACHATYVFAGTSQSCAACHREPELHAGQFGQDCSRCHTAVAWAPAQLTQHRFALDHGITEPLDCVACHSTAYYQVVCADCHETAEIETAHTPENVPDYLPESSCISCHPTGEPEDVMPVAKINPPTTD
jgi:hypothetical protein